VHSILAPCDCSDKPTTIDACLTTRNPPLTGEACIDWVESRWRVCREIEEVTVQVS